MKDERFCNVGHAMPERLRASWMDFVVALHEAHADVLSGWLFHGTTKSEYESMRRVGFLTTDVTIDEEEGFEGTYWAKPLIAAFYAEDRIESLERPDVPLVILAIPLAELAASGELVQDELSIMSPLTERLGRTEGQVDEIYAKALERGMPRWEASLEATESVACLATKGPELRHIVPLASVADVAALVFSMEAERTQVAARL